MWWVVPHQKIQPFWCFDAYTLERFEDMKSVLNDINLDMKSVLNDDINLDMESIWNEQRIYDCETNL